MTDPQKLTDARKLLYSVAIGIAAFAAITALYYVEGREPNNSLVGAAAVMAGIGLWHFLGRKSKS
jgi:NO-binding membrane sensor protein with MHYT domain